MRLHNFYHGRAGPPSYGTIKKCQFLNNKARCLLWYLLFGLLVFHPNLSLAKSTTTFNSKVTVSQNLSQTKSPAVDNSPASNNEIIDKTTVAIIGLISVFITLLLKTLGKKKQNVFSNTTKSAKRKSPNVCLDEGHRSEEGKEGINITIVIHPVIVNQTQS